MATFKQGILGGFSGKVGGAVGSSWKGINVMKSMPVSVANPRTAGQVSQRSKFKTIVELGSANLTGVCKPLWDRFSQKKSGYNAFVQANIDNCDANGIIVPADFITSRGALTPIEVSVCSYNSTLDEFTTDWVDNSGEGSALATDKVFIMIYNKTQNVSFSFDTANIRGEVQNKKNNGIAIAPGDEVYCYVSALRADGSIVSNSSYTAVEL